MFDDDDYVQDESYNHLTDSGITPELQAEIDEIRRKMAESTTTLGVSLDEYLEYLYELSDDALCDLFTDRAFNEWKQRLEYTHDADLLEDVLAFMSAKQDVPKIESGTRILHSLARNGNIPADIIQELLGLSSTYKLDLEELLADGGNLTDEQALRLARTGNASVRWNLAHNRDVPHAALKALASRTTVKPGLLEQILSNPSCTPEIRRLLDPEAVAMFDDLKAARLVSIAHAQFGDEFWEAYEVSACFLDDMVAAMNPNLPFDIAAQLEARRDEVGAVARHMNDAGEYAHLQFEYDLDDDDYDFTED